MHLLPSTSSARDKSNYRLRCALLRGQPFSINRTSDNRGMYWPQTSRRMCMETSPTLTTRRIQYGSTERYYNNERQTKSSSGVGMYCFVTGDIDGHLLWHTSKVRV